jgi:tRNA(Ile)-lysidine synthase
MLADLPTPLVVAYSGGADSTALLLMAAQAHPGQVSAIHVHHGLQEAADDFASHAELFCQALNVPLTVLRTSAHAAAGQSPEEAARKARYLAISEAVLEKNRHLAPVNTQEFAINSVANTVLPASASASASTALALPTVLLAQHADDQVETVLLALSRGAGVDGLAGMPARFERHGLHWARPFLAEDLFMGSAQIRAWLAQQGLSARLPGQGVLGQGWVEDPTNASMAYTRNRIRAQLLPALASVFPQYRETFARSARHMAQASELLMQSAQQLQAQVGWPPQLKALQALPRQVQANYLRFWLKQAHQAMGSEAQMNELLDQIAACTTKGHHIRIKIAAGYIQREGAQLRYERGSGS